MFFLEIYALKSLLSTNLTMILAWLSQLLLHFNLLYNYIRLWHYHGDANERCFKVNHLPHCSLYFFTEALVRIRWPATHCCCTSQIVVVILIHIYHGWHRPDALHCSGLCYLRASPCSISRHWPVPCIFRGPSEYYTWVPAGWSQHELPTSLTVPACHFSVGCRHFGCTSWNLCLWHTVLVPWLLLLPGPAHPSTHLHSSFLPPASFQRLSGVFLTSCLLYLNCNLFICFRASL